MKEQIFLNAVYPFIQLLILTRRPKPSCHFCTIWNKSENVWKYDEKQVMLIS